MAQSQQEKELQNLKELIVKQDAMIEAQKELIVLLKQLQKDTK